MTIAERIRLVRQQKKLSQTELALKAEVNLKSLSRYELGSSIPPADILKKIADALEVSADALLNDGEIQIKDKALFERFEVIQQMSGEQKSMVLHFLDMAVRDFKTKQTYTH